MTGHSQPVHPRYFSFVRPRKRWLDQFYELSRDKQDVDLATCATVCAAVLTLSRKWWYAFWFPPLPCDIGGAYDRTIFIRSFGPDPLLILTLFGLLVGGEWWFRRVFYIARFVLLAWDRAARFNSVRTADIVGRLLFSAPSYAMMAEIEIIWISLSMSCLPAEEIFCSSAGFLPSLGALIVYGLYAIMAIF